MRVDGGQVRAGMVLDFEGKLWMVTGHEIRTPGNLRSFNQVEMKDIKSGIKKNMRLRPDEGMDRVTLEQRKFQFLFADGDTLTFMDEENYEQITMERDFLGDRAAFLQDGMVVQVELHENTPIGVKLPDNVILEIVEGGFGKAFGQFGFADTGGPEEHEGADGLVGFFEPGIGALHGVGDGINRRVLTHDAFTQLAIQRGDLGGCAAHDLFDGQAFFLGDLPGDAFFGDFGLAC